METNRRDFIKQAALVAGGLIVEPGFPMAQDLFSPDSRMVGIQMAAHSLYDEGIEPTLDFLKEHAAINTLMIYSHTYYGIDKKPHQVLAKDHGVEPQDLTKRKLPHVWVKHHETHFQKTILRHSQPDPTTEYTNKDIFKDILRPVRDRGMKVYARILEAGNNIALSSIKNFDQVGVVDVYGKKGIAPCWNNPQYQNWIYGTVEDIFNTYDIDGLQYGAERSGPLSNLLFKGETPTCFCEHCKARNRKMNIDPDRAMEGYRHLHDFLKKVEADQPHGHETPMTMIFRYLQRYPEMLAWNYQWFQADEEIQKEMYRRVKKLKPQATVGRHVDHQRSSWDIFYRAAVDYGEMADHTDFIKPILYHDIYGPRLRWWVIEQWQKRIFKGLSREQALEVFYTWLGYSKPAQVALNQLETMGMGPDYVYDETKRCVDAVQGKVPVIAGIGLDVPWHSPQGLQPFHSDPEKLQQAIFKAAQAGASGFLASREYDEMRHSSLRAFGSAIKQL